MALEVNRLADPAARTLAVRTPTPRPTPPPAETDRQTDVQRAPTEAARTELSQGQQVEARRIGETLQTATEQLGFAQAADAELRSGITALERLGELATEAQTSPAPAPALQQEATAIAEQLETADRSETLQRVQSEIEAQTARREVEEAEQQVARLDAEPTEPTVPRQSTLALVPLGPTDGAAERARAEQAVQDARRELEDAEGGGRVSPIIAAVLRPASADVSTPEAAAETGEAVSDALERATSLRGQVRTLGDDAADRARGARESLGTSSGGATRGLSDPQRAQDTAARVARSTVENPAQALAGQPFVSVASALRVLA